MMDAGFMRVIYIDNRDRPLKIKGGHFLFLRLISHHEQPAPPIAKPIIMPI